LGIYSKIFKSEYNTDTCTSMCIVSLFIMAKLCNQLWYPSTDEWIKEMWFICTINFYSVIKKNETVIFRKMEGTGDYYVK
jgi:hypothetical protein